MSKTSKIILGVVVAALVVAGGFWFGNKPKTPDSSQIQSTPITIGYRAHDLYAPVFVGIEKGIFAKHGLDVKAVKFESTNQLTDALIAGSIDTALGGVNTPLVFTIEEKAPGTIKIFSVFKETAEQAASYVLVKPNSDIKSVADLKGKKVGSYTGSTVAVLYKMMVGKYFDPKDATLIQMKPELEVAALESGQVDAIIILEPGATAAVQKGAARVLVKSAFHEFMLNNAPLASSVVSTKYMKENSAGYEKLKLALREVVEYMEKNSSETRAIMNTYTKVDSTVGEALPIPHIITREEIPVEELERLVDVLVKQGELKQTIDVQKVLAP